MIHMGSDHRCVMATFTITTSGKSSHYKTFKGKYEKIKDKGRDQTRKNIEVEKPELEKRCQEIIEKNRKTAATKKAAAQAESEDFEAQAKI